MNSDTLKKIALECEKYEREIQSSELKEGLSSYINKIPMSDVVDYIITMTIKYPELTIHKFWERGIKIGEYDKDDDKNLEKLPLKNMLIPLALTCESIENTKYNFQPFGGWVDYVHSLNSTAVLNMIKDYKSRYNKTLEELFKEAVDNGFFSQEDFVVLNNQLASLPIDTLRTWALVWEQYQREKNGNYYSGSFYKNILSTSRDKLVSLISNYLSKNHEMNFKYELSSKAENYGFNAIPFQGTIKHLEDYMFRVPIIQLTIWAKTCEEHYKRNSVPFKKIIENATKEELRTILFECIQQFPIWDSNTKLDEWTKQYDIDIKDSLRASLLDTAQPKLENYTKALVINNLIKNNEIIVNLIDDYIASLPQIFLVNYILLMRDNDESLKDLDSIKNWAKKYGFTEDSLPMYDKIGIMEDINKANDETLKQWAISCESWIIENYDTEIHYFGGLKDYIYNFSRQQTIFYIVGMIMRTGGSLDDLEKMKYTRGDKADFGEKKKQLEGFEISKLQEIAIVVEKYHRDSQKNVMNEGLYDLISSKSKEELVDHIISVLKLHLELLPDEAVNALLVKYNLNKKSSLLH